MRDPRNALRPFAVKETQAARDKLAATLYAPDRVRELVVTAAQAGLDSVRISQDTPTPLRHTPAAAELAAWAAALKFTLVWETRLVAGPDGRQISIFEPVLGWEE
jgi:hypothetical protein